LIGGIKQYNSIHHLTDAQGSLLTSLSASAIIGEQLSAPYGPTRYTVGSLGTAKAFTGQEADALTGLSYYHARWYDPVTGLFVSVDTQEGNAQGVNPYGYVRENPETWTDPTGERVCIDNGATCKDPRPGGGTYCYKNGPNCSGGPSGPSYNDCAANPSLQGCSKYPCAAGPLSTNNCTYGSGDCKGLTFAGCKKQHAYKDAARARDHFRWLANLFGGALFWIISTILTVLTSVLSFFAGPLLTIIGGIVTGLEIGLGLVGLMAGRIADVFSNETDMVEMVNKQGLSWFTLSNLDADKQQIGDSITGFHALGTGINILTAIGTLFGGAIKGAAVAGTAITSTILKLGAWGATTALVAEAVETVGATILLTQANGYINQEEADIA
jgi:RHS repeat-associated protein